MLRQPEALVKSRVAPLICLCACAAPPPVSTPVPAATAEETRVELTMQRLPGEHGIIGAGGQVLAGARLSEREAPEPDRGFMPDDETSVMWQLADPVDDASVVDEGGDEIEAALAGFSSRQIANYGAGLLTQIQLFGDPFHAPICHPPEIRAELLDGDDQPWEASISLPQYAPFIGDPEPVMSALSRACEDGLSAAGGDVDAAVDAGDCTEAEQHQFFEEGACRDCVEGNGGDLATCQDSAACPVEAPEETWVLEDGEKVWYDLVSAVAWACAPDWLAPAYLLARVDDDGTLPQSFDHADWNYYCFLLYFPDDDSQGYVCDAGDGPTLGHTLGEGLVARTRWMKDRDGVVAHQQREVYTPELTLDTGDRVRWFWANSSNIGRISKPIVPEDTNGDGVVDVADRGFGYPTAAWGLNPHALRPDGTDPTRLDDTTARDWLATIALKTATTMDGVSILTFNHDRCEQWEGPDDQGGYRCLAMGEPDAGWLNDALHYGDPREDGQTYSYPVPLTTIGSTGLPDPKVPGGIVPLIAGSQRLAEPGWDDCVWPDSFVADTAPYPDVPWDYAGSASIWGDTYRFGKDPDLDLRVVLNTTIARHYCPDELP